MTRADFTSLSPALAPVLCVLLGCRNAEEPRVVASEPEPQPTAPHSQEGALIMFEDQDVMARRLEPEAAAPTMDAIDHLVDDMIATGQFPADAPFTVIIAVKPERRLRAWVDGIGVPLDAVAAKRLRDRVEGVPAPVVVGGPIALGYAYGPPGIEQHYDKLIPSEWSGALDRVDMRLPVPDSFLDVVWPDDEDLQWREIHSRGGFRVRVPGSFVENEESERDESLDATVKRYTIHADGRDGVRLMVTCASPVRPSFDPHEHLAALAKDLPIAKSGDVQQGSGRGVELVLAPEGGRPVMRWLVFQTPTGTKQCQLLISPSIGGHLSSAMISLFMDSFHLDDEQ